MELVIAEMKTQFLEPVVFETVRTNARQEYLYGFGRDYDDGRGQVTKARTADQSWHKYGLAADIICARQGWNAPPSFWKALGEAAKVAGLIWGGDWPRRDLPHVQWPSSRADDGTADDPEVSPDATELMLFQDGGMAAVWAAEGAD